MIDDEVTVNKKFKETIIVLNFKSQALFITKEKINKIKNKILINEFLVS